jgi:L,D-peptidoglycan transpeptidase YkuD (ErfK/YbiS/YcfS/YnhG family)
MKRLERKPGKEASRREPGAKGGLTRLAATQGLMQARPEKFRLGRLHAGPLTFRCALGCNGISRRKREGDHATPAGSFRFLFGYFRADRVPRRAMALSMRPLSQSLGWCDDSRVPAYNRPVRLPFRASHEILWREDRLYDLVIVLDYNMYPRRRNRGSAIFLHCCREGFFPTEGCIALDPADLRRLLPRLSRKAVLTIR